MILAGISIAMLSGDNSILSKAGEARDITGTRDIEERIQIAYLGVLAEGNGNVEKGKFQTALENEFGAGKVTDLADDLSTVKIDGKEYQTGVTEGTSGGGGSNPTGLAGLTDAERELLQTGVSEIAYDDITNDNLKEPDKIKAVITGEVPITTEMTYVTGTVDTGVVVSINGSEFVWVPVPVAISSDASTISTSGVNLATNQSTERPMAKLQSGSSTNYEGLLYYFSGTTSTYKPGYTVTDTSTYREPAYLSGSSYDDNTTYGGLFTAADLQTSYNTMVAGICFHFSKCSFRFFLLLGRNAPKKNGVEGSPEATRAVRQALAPGTGTTVMPFWIASWAMASPGSEMPGKPASVTRATFCPCSSSCNNTGPCFSLLFSS